VASNRLKLTSPEFSDQREGEVTHVIVKHCYDMSVLRYQLTESINEEPPVLTLARADEKDGDRLTPQEKKKQISRVVQAEIFPGGRNFR
jgi:error-prone DNA polymerase